ncbi:hypothetical protein ABK040_009479 [Willaertia magna]
MVRVEEITDEEYEKEKVLEEKKRILKEKRKLISNLSFQFGSFPISFILLSGIALLIFIAFHPNLISFANYFSNHHLNNNTNNKNTTTNYISSLFFSFFTFWYHYQFVAKIIFFFTFLAHASEAFFCYLIIENFYNEQECKELKLERDLWVEIFYIIQTFIVGFPSLLALNKEISMIREKLK